VDEGFLTLCLFPELVGLDGVLDIDLVSVSLLEAEPVSGP